MWCKKVNTNETSTTTTTTSALSTAKSTSSKENTNDEENNESSSSVTAGKTKETESTVAKMQSSTLWDNEKANVLVDFMVSWGRRWISRIVDSVLGIIQIYMV